MRNTDQANIVEDYSVIKIYLEHNDSKVLPFRNTEIHFIVPNRMNTKSKFLYHIAQSLPLALFENIKSIWGDIRTFYLYKNRDIIFDFYHRSRNSLSICVDYNCDFQIMTVIQEQITNNDSLAKAIKNL